jgi:hypothetical protein
MAVRAVLDTGFVVVVVKKVRGGGRQAGFRHQFPLELVLTVVVYSR